MNGPKMDHQFRRLLQIVSITVLWSTGYSKPCTGAVLEECTKELLQGGYNITATIVPVFNETSLAKRCQDYASFEECMKDVKYNCERYERLLFEGIEDSNAWLCVEEKEQYLRHQECFADTDLHRELRVCFVTYENKIDSVIASSSSLRRLCQYTNEYLDCVDGEVTSFCGAEAGMWQRTFEQKSIEPITDSINCAIDNGRSTTQPVDNGRSTTQPVDNGRRTTHPFDNGQRTTHPFDYGRRTTHPFDYGRRTTYPFDNGRRTTHPFDNRRRNTHLVDNERSTTKPVGYAKIIIPVVVCIFLIPIAVFLVVKKCKKRSQTTETDVHGTSASHHDTVAGIAGLAMSSTASRREPYQQTDFGTGSLDVTNDMLTPKYPEACGYNVFADKESSTQNYWKSEVAVHPAIINREISLPDCRATHVYGHPVGLSTESSPPEYAESNPPANSELGV